MNPNFSIPTSIVLNEQIREVMVNSYMHPSQFDDMSAMGQRALSKKNSLPIDEQESFSYADFLVENGYDMLDVKEYYNIVIEEMYAKSNQVFL
jgi:hypothetical protein